MHFIIGTAGHVDHGKTTLILALTGIETDRLREEKERGLSIVPGFAHLQLSSAIHSEGRTVGIVDVPGHERFLKNMLTGISGVDIALLLVAADEGVMPQTLEHLHVLELLQVRRGLILLTKCDAVDDEWRSLARDDVRSKLRQSGGAQSALWREAPLVEVAAVRGDGLEALQSTLGLLCDELESEAASVAQPFRLAVDRAFSVEGIGTVVTGSVGHGSLQENEAVEVWPLGAERPLPSRARHLQSHGQAVAKLERGQRGAINVAAIEVEAARAAMIAAPGALTAARRLDVWLQWLPDAPRPLKNHARLRLHLATTETGVRVALFDGETGETRDDEHFGVTAEQISTETMRQRRDSGRNREAFPSHGAVDMTVYARLHGDAPLACAPGDRFVVREVGTERVVGGGRVLSVESELTRREAPPFLAARHQAIEAGDDAALARCVLREAGLSGANANTLRRAVQREDIASLLAEWESSGLIWRLPANGADERKAKATFFERPVLEMGLALLTQVLHQWHASHPLHALAPRESLRADLVRLAHQMAAQSTLSAPQQAVPGTSPSQVDVSLVEVPRSGWKVEPSPSLVEAWLQELARRGDIALEAGGARAIGHRVQLSPSEARVQKRIEAAIEGAGYQLLTSDEIVASCETTEAATARKLLIPALKAGELVRVGEWVTTPHQLARGAEILRGHFANEGDLSVSQARELLGTTRKWAVPLLEWYDRAGLTRRDGEVRRLR